MNYERLNQLIALSLVDGKASLIKDFAISSRSMRVTFSDYVKSQIHLNISGDLFNLPLSVFVNTSRFMNGLTSYRESALKVLNRFYLDLSNFLVRNPYDISLDVVVDCDLGIEEKQYDIGVIKSGILGVVSGEPESIAEFDHSEIIDCASSAQDLQDKINSYAVAAALKSEVRHAQHGTIRRIKIGGLDESKG